MPLNKGVRIAFVGDIHGQLNAMYEKLQEWQERTGTLIDAIVQVGDFGVFTRSTDFAKYWGRFEPAPIETYAIMGNHEDPDLVRRWGEQPERIPGMHLMRDGEITNICGVKVGGVWGNFSPASWAEPDRVTRHRNGGNSPRIAMHIDKKAVYRLIDDPGPMDALVTHDASRAYLPLQFHKPVDAEVKSVLGLEQSEEPNGCPGFDEIIAKHRPKNYFFGHLHHYDAWPLSQTGPGSDQFGMVMALNALFYPGGQWFFVVEFL